MEVGAIAEGKPIGEYICGGGVEIFDRNDLIPRLAQ